MTKTLLKLIRYIKDPDYVVMWNDPHSGNFILSNKIIEKDDELKVYFPSLLKYIDLYNITTEDIKVYKEVTI